MRVVEPHQFNKLPKVRRTRRPYLILFVVILLAVGSVVYALNRPTSKPSETSKLENSAEIPAQTPTVPANAKLKAFTGEQFKELYRSMVYPNTQQFVDLPPITGNVEADNRIRSMADARGYMLTSIPVQAIIKINEPRLEGDDLLQPLAAQGWSDLKAAAKKDNIPLTLLSAYRSPEYQRNLFTQRLYALGVTAKQVAAAQADVSVKETLSLTAVPGYSRHHTGYTVDFWCEDGSGRFLSSKCFGWISANNYERVKEYGWIPSYPEGANEQGPEPEPWEYVWVGRNRLTE